MTKRALCVASNYIGTSSQLAGCLNDAEAWSAVLRDRGFEVETLLGKQATRAAILDRATELVKATGADDLAVKTWSGHGTWRVDRDGDEPDRRDEMICPDDYARSGHIADDDLYSVFTSGHRWARVVFISDSCHSGSVNRLAPALEATPYRGSAERLLGKGGAERLDYRRAKFLPPAEWMDTEDLVDAEQAQHAPSRGRPRGSALLLAACKDTEVAYDAWFDSRPNGAFTYAALQALAENPATYRDWQRGIRRRLPSVDYQQTPEMTGGSGQRRWLTLEAEGTR